MDRKLENDMETGGGGGGGTHRIICIWGLRFPLDGSRECKEEKYPATAMMPGFYNQKAITLKPKGRLPQARQKMSLILSSPAGRSPKMCPIPLNALVIEILHISRQCLGFRVFRFLKVLAFGFGLQGLGLRESEREPAFLRTAQAEVTFCWKHALRVQGPKY